MYSLSMNTQIPKEKGTALPLTHIQAQESLAAAMSLNSIVTSWADDCIETTDSKLLQPSTGNTQNVTFKLYPLTFAFKGKL